MSSQKLALVLSFVSFDNSCNKIFFFIPIVVFLLINEIFSFIKKQNRTNKLGGQNEGLHLPFEARTWQFQGMSLRRQFGCSCGCGCGEDL